MSEKDENKPALTAPPKALPEDSPAIKIGNAVERVTAVSEGSALMDFLGDEGYALQMAEMPRGIWAQCSPVTRHLYFNVEASADEIAAYLPHEAFHGIQFSKLPLLSNFFACMQSSEPPEILVRDGNIVDVLKPSEYLYALNLSEMAAYAVQVDVVTKMEQQASDAAAGACLDKNLGSLKRIYEDVAAQDDLARIVVSGRALINAPHNIVGSVYSSDKIATDFLARHWFWASSRGIDNEPNRLHYADGHMEFFAEKSEDPKSYYNFMRGEGYAFEFRALSDEEIRSLGRGCGYDVFGAPEFDDVRSDDYRAVITDENRAELMKINRTLGLS